MKKKRSAKVVRRTKETEIKVNFLLDGEGKSSLQTGIPFLDHMLTLFAKHGRFDLFVEAAGDLEVDSHHTVEDIGICLGKAVNQALGEKEKIRRYGFTLTPMDETLTSVVIDISARPYLVFNIPVRKRKSKELDSELAEEFLRAFTINAGITLHINLNYGRNWHHILEAVFKGLGQALDRATQIDSRVKGIPSTKGVL